MPFQLTADERAESPVILASADPVAAPVAAAGD
jgi:hypothetical protein